jgi:hypothetical protein
MAPTSHLDPSRAGLRRPALYSLAALPETGYSVLRIQVVDEVWCPAGSEHFAFLVFDNAAAKDKLSPVRSARSQWD